MASDLTEAEARVQAALEKEAAEPEVGKSRRALLKALGVAAAGAVAGGVLSVKEAQAHGSFHQESNNGDPAIHGDNTNGGAGVMGTSLTAWGVDGQCDNGTGVRGRSLVGNGVHGTSAIGTGVVGSSDTGTGVSGTSDTDGVTGTSNIGAGTGVRGDSHGVNGIGVAGHSDPGTGVSGSSLTGIGVLGSSQSGAAVEGRSETHIGGLFSTNSGTGVMSDSQTGHGVDGRSHSDGGIGVRGEVDGLGEGVQGSSSLDGDFGKGPGTGVTGISGTGIGVRGVSDSGTGVVAVATSPAGLALEVLGRVVFSTSGSAVIPAFQDSAFVGNAVVTDESHITATLTGTPGAVISGFPAVIQWVERQPGTGFVVRMTRRVGQATPFTYLIVEPEPG